MNRLPEILLIEDSKDDRDLFELALLSSGMQALLTKTAGATEAVIRLNRIGRFKDFPPPAVIVVDLALPDLQGTTLLSIIKSTFAPLRVPIVVFTGSLLEQDRATCVDLGVDDYVVKPGNFADLVRFVASLKRLMVAEAVPGAVGTAHR